MWESGIVTFSVWQILSGEGAEYFNYFFTLVGLFGVYALVIGLLVRTLTKT